MPHAAVLVEGSTTAAAEETLRMDTSIANKIIDQQTICGTTLHGPSQWSLFLLRCRDSDSNFRALDDRRLCIELRR
jgi:hypothetical protein